MCKSEHQPIKYIFNSANRYTGTNAKPTFVLPRTVADRNTFLVKSIEIPFNFYNINSTNNVIEWISNTPTSTTSTITAGNYTITELLTEIGSVMTADTDDGGTYTSTKNSKTSKITIAGDAGNFEINWNTNDITKKLATMLGYHDVDSGAATQPFTQYTDSTGASTYTGPNSYFVGVRYLNVHSNLTKYTDYYSKYTTNKTSGISGEGRFDIISKIPLNDSSPGQQIVYRPFQEYIYHLKSTDVIQDVTFEITDQNLDLIDLNGVPWSIELIFE